MCINDGTIGLFEVANKILKQSHLHFEPLVLVILLHHLQEGRSNLGDLAFLRKMQRRWGRTSFRDRERLEESPARSAVLRHSSAFERLRVRSDARIPRDRLV